MSGKRMFLYFVGRCIFKFPPICTAAWNWMLSFRHEIFGLLLNPPLTSMRFVIFPMISLTYFIDSVGISSDEINSVISFRCFTLDISCSRNTLIKDYFCGTFSYWQTPLMSFTEMIITLSSQPTLKRNS